MRVLLQRVSESRVRVEGEVIAEIAVGLNLLVGFGQNDHELSDAFLEKVARKLIGLRVFSDEQGRLMHDLAAVDGALLIVPQFTLYGSARKGRRPDFIDALSPEIATRHFDRFCDVCARLVAVERGRFGATMAVEIVNDGPFTLHLEFHAE